MAIWGVIHARIALHIHIKLTLFNFVETFFYTLQPGTIKEDNIAVKGTTTRDITYVTHVAPLSTRLHGCIRSSPRHIVQE